MSLCKSRAAVLSASVALLMLFRSLRLAALGALLCLPAFAAPAYPIPDDAVISLQRGNCEGGCPVYRVLIFANGDAIWHGRYRVAKVGVVLSQITPDQVRELIEDFQAVDYFHLDNSYGYRDAGCHPSAPGMSTMITSLAMGGQSKTLTHYEGCVGDVSDKLAALENHIDQTVNTARWIASKSPARK
jgi:hypothetical protein